VQRQEHRDHDDDHGDPDHERMWPGPETKGLITSCG
jgi:hypothetical protein